MNPFHLQISQVTYSKTMAGARGKVVRLEAVSPTGGGVHFEEDNLLELDAPTRRKNNTHLRLKEGEYTNIEVDKSSCHRYIFLIIHFYLYCNLKKCIVAHMFMCISSL